MGSLSVNRVFPPPVSPVWAAGQPGTTQAAKVTVGQVLSTDATSVATMAYATMTPRQVSQVLRESAKSWSPQDVRTFNNAVKAYMHQADARVQRENLSFKGGAARTLPLPSSKLLASLLMPEPAYRLLKSPPGAPQENVEGNNNSPPSTNRSALQGQQHLVGERLAQWAHTWQAGPKSAKAQEWVKSAASMLFMEGKEDRPAYKAFYGNAGPLRQEAQPGLSGDLSNTAAKAASSWQGGGGSERQHQEEKEEEEAIVDDAFLDSFFKVFEALRTRAYQYTVSITPSPQKYRINNVEAPDQNPFPLVAALLLGYFDLADDYLRQITSQFSLEGELTSDVQQALEYIAAQIATLQGEGKDLTSTNLDLTTMYPSPPIILPEPKICNGNGECTSPRIQYNVVDPRSGQTGIIGDIYMYPNLGTDPYSKTIVSANILVPSAYYQALSPLDKALVLTALAGAGTPVSSSQGLNVYQICIFFGVITDVSPQTNPNFAQPVTADKVMALVQGSTAVINARNTAANILSSQMNDAVRKKTSVVQTMTKILSRYQQSTDEVAQLQFQR